MEEFAEILESVEDLSAFDDERLTEARAQIAEYGRALRQTDATGDELAQLVADAKALKSAMDAIDVELSNRVTVRAEAEAQKEEAFAAFADPESAEPGKPDPDTPEPGTEDEPDQPQAEVPAVAAAAVIRRRGEVRRPRTAEPVEAAPRALVAAAVGSENLGSRFLSPTESARALWDAARRGGMGEQAVLRIPVETGTELSGDAYHNFAEIRKLQSGVQAARDQGEALTAAGFCAPAEVVYDFFSASSATAGVIDLPEANASRGRINYPVSLGPVDLANTAGLGSEYTGADDGAGTQKTCYTVVCGDDDIYEVSATYSCLLFSNFDSVFYPERVEALQAEAMTVAAHNANRRIIDDIVTAPATTFINDLEDQGGDVDGVHPLRCSGVTLVSGAA